MTTRRSPRWSLTLYVSGASPRSAQALETVRRLCDEELAGQVELEVVDVADEPALAARDRIVAVPTLVKRLPAPPRQLVGDLADVDRVRAGLDLGPAPSSGRAVTRPPEDGVGEPADELGRLRTQIEELDRALTAIRAGDVDAVVLGGPDGHQLYTLVSADRPYRVIVEEMGDGAVTVSERGIILYANLRLADLVGADRAALLGRDVTELVDASAADTLSSLLASDRARHHPPGRARARPRGRLRRAGARLGDRPGHRGRHRPVPHPRRPHRPAPRRGGTGRRLRRAEPVRARTGGGAADRPDRQLVLERGDRRDHLLHPDLPHPRHRSHVERNDAAHDPGRLLPPRGRARWPPLRANARSPTVGRSSSSSGSSTPTGTCARP